MITESEYLEAKKIVDEYERRQYMEKQGEAEDDLNDDYEYEYDEDWSDDDGDDYAMDAAVNCTCGAWELSHGRPLHIADCICGAD